MTRSIYFRLLLVVALSIMVAGIPQSSFAQRGGFHGSGGFHGGAGFRSGGSGFHGGGFGGSRGSFGAFRGGHGFGGFGGRGFGGFRGGRFHGGFRGYPGFYSGFGFGFGFGFGWPYWGAYPYGYGYSPWWGVGPYAYHYPYGYGYGYDRYDDPDWGYRRYDRRPRDNDSCRDYRHDCPPPADSKPKGDGGPAKPSNGSADEGSSAGNYLTVNFLDLRPQASIGGTKENGVPLRPAVRNAIAALRAMPPAARERQLNSGRYASFSAEERELLLKATVQFRETYN